MNKQTKILLILFLAGILFSQSFGWTSADTNADRLKALNEQAEKFEKLIEIKKQQQWTIGNQLSILETENKKIEIEIEIKKEALGDVSSQVDRLNGQIQEYEKSIQSQRMILGDLLRSYYESKRGDEIVKLFGQENFYSVLKNEDSLLQAEERVKEVVDNISALKNNLDKEKQLQEKKQNELKVLTDQLEEKNKTIDNNKNQKEYLLEQTKGEETKYSTLLDKVEEQRRAIEQEIEAIESGKSGQIDWSKLPPIKKGYFSYPVGKINITQGYGKTSYSSHYYSGMHNGIDFGTDRQYVNIFAAKSGKVLATGNNGKNAYGKWIAIDHGDGLVTLYGHLSSLSVSKGSAVKEGAVIAISGNTGYSTGPHLHFSVFSKSSFEVVASTKVSGLMIPVGSSINPNTYLK